MQLNKESKAGISSTVERGTESLPTFGSVHRLSRPVVPTPTQRRGSEARQGAKEIPKGVS
jgi:hypothetical protein